MAYKIFLIIAAAAGYSFAFKHFFLEGNLTVSEKVGIYSSEFQFNGDEPVYEELHTLNAEICHGLKIGCKINSLLNVYIEPVVNVYNYRSADEDPYYFFWPVTVNIGNFSQVYFNNRMYLLDYKLGYYAPEVFEPTGSINKFAASFRGSIGFSNLIQFNKVKLGMYYDFALGYRNQTVYLYNITNKVRFFESAFRLEFDFLFF